MARKSFSFVLTALTSQPSGGNNFNTSITMRDWDDEQEISFNLFTPFQILKTGNLSIRAELDVVPGEEPPDVPGIAPRIFLFNTLPDRTGLFASGVAQVVLDFGGDSIRPGPIPIFTGYFFQVTGDPARYYPPSIFVNSVPEAPPVITVPDLVLGQLAPPPS